MVVLNKDELSLKVSSVLNKDVKQFGKQFLIDGKDETCWNSDQGNNQWIECQFKQEVCLVAIGLQFQGGFTSNKIILQFFDRDQNLISQQFIYAVDKNHLQVFNNLSPVLANSLKLVFTEFNDPFGRIIIYKLELIRKDT